VDIKGAVAPPPMSGTAELTVVPSTTIVTVPVGVTVLDATPESTEMVIMWVATEASVEIDAKSATEEGAADGEEPTVKVTVLFEGA
jgi:hypothetical protein